MFLEKTFLHEKTLDTFTTVSKSINDANNIAENNKTLTESINNLLLEITATNKTVLDNGTRERNILNYNKGDINKEVEKRKQLHYQIYRSQQLLAFTEL